MSRGRESRSEFHVNDSDEVTYMIRGTMKPQNDGLAKAGSNEAKSVSWHSDPERGFQPDRAALRVLQGWRRHYLHVAVSICPYDLDPDPMDTRSNSSPCSSTMQIEQPT